MKIDIIFNHCFGFGVVWGNDFFGKKTIAIRFPFVLINIFRGEKNETKSNRTL